MTAATGGSSEDGIERVVDERLRGLLAEIDGGLTGRTAIRGRQFDLGLAWVSQPLGEGGLGAPPALQPRIDEALADRGAGIDDGCFFGATMAGTTIAAHGSPEQKARLLRGAFTGDDTWCQLFSEPGAGSDLAGLATRAVRDGDTWIVNGQNVWNTLAHIADFGMLLVRSDPDVPKHRGITYLVLDMHAPGVEVRPLRQITGDAEFNEVYLTDVSVPDADRIGDVDGGWGIALTTLMNERNTLGAAAVSFGEQPSDEHEDLTNYSSVDEALRIWRSGVEQTPARRDRVVQAWIEATVLRITNERAAARRAAGIPGPEGSIAKLFFAEHNQRVYELCVDLLGAQGLVGFDYEAQARPGGLVGPPGAARQFFLRSRANSIEGGTSEVQRNIIGERILGLPQEPRTDRAVPWSQVPRS